MAPSQQSIAADLAGINRRLDTAEQTLGVLVQTLGVLVRHTDSLTALVERVHESDAKQLKLLGEIRDALREAAGK